MPSFHVSASNAIVLTQSGERTVSNAVEALDDLTLFVSVIINHKLVTVSDTLTLTQNVITQGFFVDNILSTIELSQSVNLNGIRSLNVSETLLLNQNANKNIKEGLPISTLALTQTATYKGPKVALAVNNITFPSDADGLFSIDLTDPDELAAYLATIGLRHSVRSTNVYNRSLTTYLNLTQLGAKATFLEAGNHLHLTDLALKVLYDSILNVLQLTQTVVVHSVEPAENEISLEQDTLYNTVSNRSLLTNLSLDNIVTFINVTDLCTYAPGVGQHPTLKGPMMTVPVLVRRSTTLFTYPYPNATIIVEVPNPEFDDNRQLEFRKINRKSRGGSLKIYSDSMWPKSERLIYSFNNLKEIKKKELLSFFETTIGKEIGILDFNSRQWRGIILTPNSQISNEDRPGNSLTVEFEGSVDPGTMEAAIVVSSKVTGNMDEVPAWFQAFIGSETNVTADLTRD